MCCTQPGDKLMHALLQMAGATVLITGASGFVGGACLEMLLRTTNVSKVYVLLRGKKGTGELQGCCLSIAYH